jgi:hypothetical protein
LHGYISQVVPSGRIKPLVVVSEKTQTKRKVRDNKINANVKKERVAAAKAAAEKAKGHKKAAHSIKRRRVDKT